MMKSRLMVAACATCLMTLTGASAASAQSGADTPPTAAHAGHPVIGPWGFDLAGRDLSVKPGDDFEAYASGAYLANTEIPADKPAYGAFDMLQNAERPRHLCRGRFLWPEGRKA